MYYAPSGATKEEETLKLGELFIFLPFKAVKL
jgi:hypothetical protein